MRTSHDSSEKDVGSYSKQLELGGSEIEHRFFRRQVLDRYKQDPRYKFQEWGFAGSIFIKDEAFVDSSTAEADKIAIQSFGIAYTQEGERVVAVILSDLDELSVEHQLHWSSFEIKEKCLMDSDYVRTNFEGEFSDRVSVFSAFTQELEEINKICNLMGEPSLFRRSFTNEPPRELDWLTKPTASDYSSFVHTLDKLISENINRDFFEGKINIQEEIAQKKGKVRIIDKGSIGLLEEYLAKSWRFRDPKLKDEMIETFKRIRALRQKPAHLHVDDKYDSVYHQQQRDLIFRAYKSVRTLRLLLMNHPRAKLYNLPEWLQKGRIG